MRILVELKIENDKEERLKYEFIGTLIKDLKNELVNDIGCLNYEKIEKAILNFPVLWKLKKKPDSIDVEKLILDIISNIKAYELKDNKFMIQIDKYAKLKNSNTSLETIAKVIDYGSPGTLPIRFFAKHFNNFREKSKTYWDSYKQFRTKIKVKRIITIT